HIVIAQEWQAGDVKARTLLLGGREWAAVRPLRILGLPRLAPGIDADRVAGLEPNPALGQDVVELPAVHRPVVRHARHAAVPRDVEHHAGGDDALGPVLARAEPRALERDLLFGSRPFHIACSSQVWQSASMWVEAMP